MSAAGEHQDPSGSETYFWSQRLWWRMVGTASIAIWGSAALTFVGSIVAARALGPADYGAVVLAIATATFVNVFLDLTLTDGVVFYGSRALEKGEIGNLRSLLKAAFISDLLVGVVIAGSLIAFAGPVSDLASGGKLDPWLLRLAALAGLATTVNSTTGAILLLARRPDLQGWMMAVGNVTRVVAIVAAIELGKGPAPVVGAYVVAGFAWGLTQLAVAWRVAWKGWTSADPTRTAGSWVRPLISFGIYTSLTTTFLSTETAAVPILLGALASPTAAGVYSIALLPLTAVLIGTTPLRLALFPEQSRLSAKGDVQALRKSVRSLTGFGFALAIPAAIAGWFLLPVLIPALFSDKFKDAVEPARILLAAAVFQLAIGSWAKSLPAAVGKPRLRTYMSAIYMVLSVGLTALLAQRLESTGGAIATSAAVISTSVAWWFVGDRMLRKEAVGVRAERPGAAEASLVEHAIETAAENRGVRP